MSNVENKSGLMIGGGVAGSLLASVCCIGPLVLTVLGVSGAGMLAEFEAIRAPTIVVVAALFAYTGFLLVKKRGSCEAGSVCADPRKYRILVVSYCIGIIVASLAISSPYWIDWILN